MSGLPSGAELQARIAARAGALAADSGDAFVELAETSAGHLAWVSGELVAVAQGDDERARLHLVAQLTAIDFNAKATAYLEAVAWRRALVEVIRELAEEALALGLTVGAQALRGLLAGMAAG